MLASPRLLKPGPTSATRVKNGCSISFTESSMLRAATGAHCGNPADSPRRSRMTQARATCKTALTMAFSVRPVEYFYINTRDELGAAYRILSALAERGVNLLAFTAVPNGDDRAQFAVFPDDPVYFGAEAHAAQIKLEGPHHAMLVQGDDALGGFASVHERLFKSGVDVYASSGVSDGHGSFGYIVYVREDQFKTAVAALAL